MPDLLILAIGQSNMRGYKQATGGNKTIPANALVWNNDELRSGNKFIPMRFGKYPLNVIAKDGNYANNLAMSFCRAASATYTPKLFMVAKGGHPIESFIPKPVRVAKNWPIPAGKSDLAPYIYNSRVGAARVLIAAKKKKFDVVIFHQGEANGNNDPETYYKKFEDLRFRLIRFGFISENTKIITGGISPIGPFYSAHKSTMLLLAANYSNVKFVDSVGAEVSVDDVHFTGQGLTTLGQRYWQEFIA
jgi:hypothetical protein